MLLDSHLKNWAYLRVQSPGTVCDSGMKPLIYPGLLGSALPILPMHRAEKHSLSGPVERLSKKIIHEWTSFKVASWDFPGSPVIRNPPARASLP